MTSKPAGISPVSADCGGGERIRAALEDEEVRGALCRAISAYVRSIEKGLDKQQAADRTVEVLNEVACRALANPLTYRPDRPVILWLNGIALNVIRGEARASAARPRGASLDEAALDGLFGMLSSSGEATSARLDVEEMLSRLPETHGQALEYRFLRGLDGQELAEALGTSPAAARMRVSRALQALRDLFPSGDAEVTP
jgi:DNA-directed RNA polymerase specialized sigma24 family protein